MNTKITLVLSALILFTGCITRTTNWNQYLGPNRNAAIEGVEIMEKMVCIDLNQVAD